MCVSRAMMQVRRHMTVIQTHKQTQAQLLLMHTEQDDAKVNFIFLDN